MSRRFLVILVAILSLSLTLVVIASATGGGGEETSLSTSGYVTEINLAPTGDLVISDPDASEIWTVDPANGNYSAYEIPSGWGVRDGHMDASGNVWWTDHSDTFGVLEQVSGNLTVYSRLWDVLLTWTVFV